MDTKLLEMALLDLSFNDPEFNLVSRADRHLLSETTKTLMQTNIDFREKLSVYIQKARSMHKENIGTDLEVASDIVLLAILRECKLSEVVFDYA